MFIVLIPVMVVLAVLFTFVWPYAQAGINALGGFIRSAGNFGLFIYGTLERLLIPTGLASPGLHPVPVHLSGRALPPWAARCWRVPGTSTTLRSLILPLPC